MRAKDFINEASKDPRARDDAVVELAKIHDQLWHGYYESKDYPMTAEQTQQLLTRADQLLKIAGRKEKNYETKYSAGGHYDVIVNLGQSLLQKLGQATPFPTGRESSAGTFTQLLAHHFVGLNARPRSFYARVWTMRSGGRYKDPENGLSFNTGEERDEAWDIIEQKGKQVHVRDPFGGNSPNRYIQIGKYLLKPGTITRGAFSDTPTSEYYIYVQSASILRNALTPQVDITDQQAAALRDIAATKNADAMEKLTALVNVLKGEEDVKRIISQSSKIDPRDKAKLDAIIAGAGQFKEPK